MRKTASTRREEMQMTYEDEQRKRNERLATYQKMSIQDLQVELDRRTREELALALEDLPNTVRQLVNQNATKLLLASLGFEESFGRWEVKRGSDRVSPVAAAIGEAAMQTLQLAVPDFVKEFIADLQKAEFLQTAGRRDYSHQLSRGIADHIHKWVEEEAKAESQKIIATLKVSKDKV